MRNFVVETFSRNLFKIAEAVSPSCFIKVDGALINQYTIENFA